MDPVTANLSNPLNSALLNNVNALKPQVAGNAQETTPGNVLESFGNVLKDQMNQVNQMQLQADEAVQTYSVGGPIELHNVILAAEKASTSMQLAIQVRNKLVQAYQEISRMQV